jgi:hypothetical protein
VIDEATLDEAVRLTVKAYRQEHPEASLTRDELFGIVAHLDPDSARVRASLGRYWHQLVAFRVVRGQT